MCRFLVYVGSPVVVSDLITEPSNSLIHQSFHSEEREEPLNGDGFGMAWYVPELSHAPGLFRSISPAWSNRNLLRLAHVTRTHCLLAHVRAASSELSVAEVNCHPFTHGPLSFMHNGDVAGFHAHRRALMGKLSQAAYDVVEGSTDSEFLFAYFLDHWRTLRDEHDGAARLASAMQKTIADTVAFTRAHAGETPSYLNMAVSDGEHAVISRFTTDAPENAESLHVHTGKVYRCHDGVCLMEEPTDGHGAIIVSSERLSDDPGWETIPANHLVVVRSDRNVQISPIAT
jgi:predicted glutamine amidotransferase